MDLLSGLRKGDSSRGGRAEFSWDQVKEDKDRENYLGHSLMAPVGRWQRGKDLTWYAKKDSNDALSAEEQRKEELRKIKEAEQDALAAALGFPVAPRHEETANPNEIKVAMREAGAGRHEDDAEDATDGRGLGFRGRREGRPDVVESREILKAGSNTLDDSYRPARRDPRRDDRGDRKEGRSDRHRRHRSRSRSKSRSRSRDRRHRHRNGERRHRDRSRSRSPRRERRHRDDDREKDRDRRSHRDELDRHRRERRPSRSRDDERSSHRRR